MIDLSEMSEWDGTQSPPNRESPRFCVRTVTGYHVGTTGGRPGGKSRPKVDYAVLDTALNYAIVQEFPAAMRTAELKRRRAAEALAAELNGR